VQQHPPGSGLAADKLHPWQAGLAIFADLGKARSARREISRFSNRTMQTRRSAGLCFSAVRCRGLAELEPCARRIACAWRALRTSSPMRKGYTVRVSRSAAGSAAAGA